jgi:hypothetical protein
MQGSEIPRTVGKSSFDHLSQPFSRADSQVSCFRRIWESEAILDNLGYTNLNRQLSRFLETIPDKLACRGGDLNSRTRS